MTSLSLRARRGFTLIELLLVIGIIAILASIVIVAINPTKQLGDARNAQRRSDVNTILNAVYQYSIDNSGNLPSGITTTVRTICMADLTGASCTGATFPNAGVDLSALVGTYLVGIPKDPQITATTGTGTYYSIVKSASTNRVTVASTHAEQSATITVTR